MQCFLWTQYSLLVNLQLGVDLLRDVLTLSWRFRASYFSFVIYSIVYAELHVCSDFSSSCPTLASLSVDILASAECRLVVLICTGFMASDMCSMCSNIIYIIPLEKYLFKSLALFWKFDLSFSLHHFYNNMKNINFDKIQLMPFPFLFLVPSSWLRLASSAWVNILAYFLFLTKV